MSALAPRGHFRRLLSNEKVVVPLVASALGTVAMACAVIQKRPAPTPPPPLADNRNDSLGESWARGVASRGNAPAEARPAPEPEPAAPQPAARIPPPRAGEGVVAVMPVNTLEAQADKGTILAFEESIRTMVGDALGPAGYTILTNETTLAVLTDNGVDAAKACEASCALSAARELKAYLFLSITLTRTEGQYLGFVRLFENARGKQLGALQLEGASVRDLRKAFADQAPAFFARSLDRR